MKTKITFFYTVLACLFLFQSAYAASSGYSGNPNTGDMYWYCESLGVIVPPPPTPQRESFCMASSPDETLDQLEFLITVQGENNIPPLCNDSLSYNLTSPFGGYNSPGISNPMVVLARYTYSLVGLSWREDVLRGYGEWSFVVSPPPDGSGFTDIYGNVVGGTTGNCY